jgi:transposase
MPTSPGTLLRRVKGFPDGPSAPPRYVGVDDWALRKGRRYGTILIDLERGRVLGILPGRDGEARKAWLRDHPGVEVITRNRAAAYARAAAQGAPQAKQVADRWHLLKNRREAVEQVLGRLSAAVREAVREGPPASSAAARRRRRTAEARQPALRRPGPLSGHQLPHHLPTRRPARPARRRARASRRARRSVRLKSAVSWQGDRCSVNSVDRAGTAVPWSKPPGRNDHVSHYLSVGGTAVRALHRRAATGCLVTLW